MTISDFLKKGPAERGVQRPRVLPTFSGPGLTQLDGRLLAVDATRRVLAAWNGGVTFVVWSFDEHGRLVEEVDVVRCAVPDLRGLRSMAEWLSARLAQWSP